MSRLGNHPSTSMRNTLITSLSGQQNLTVPSEAVGGVPTHFSPIPQNVNVRESHVHGHRAELVPAAVEGKDISNLMTMVAAMVSFLFYQGEFDFWFHPCHLLFQSAK